VTITRIPIYWLAVYAEADADNTLEQLLSQPKWSRAAVISYGSPSLIRLRTGLFTNLIASPAKPSGTQLSSYCACCTGISDLAETLEDLFWARLERRIARFDKVIVVASQALHGTPPDALLQALSDKALLKERFYFHGSITI